PKNNLLHAPRHKCHSSSRRNLVNKLLWVQPGGQWRQPAWTCRVEMVVRDLGTIRRMPKSVISHAEILGRLRAVLDEEMAALHDAYTNRSLSTVAWIARNLLELLIWTK